MEEDRERRIDSIHRGEMEEGMRGGREERDNGGKVDKEIE